MRSNKQRAIAKERVAQMNELRQQGYTLAEIGERFEITRERVRQVLVRHYGSATYPSSLLCRHRLAKVSGISETMLMQLERRGLLSPVRHGYLVLYERSDIARAQEVLQQYRRARYEERARFVERICEVCGAKFKRRQSSIRPGSPARFCSNQCQGRSLASHYGFEARHKKLVDDIFVALENLGHYELTETGSFCFVLKAQDWEEFKVRCLRHLPA